MAALRTLISSSCKAATKASAQLLRSVDSPSCRADFPIAAKLLAASSRTRESQSDLKALSNASRAVKSPSMPSEAQTSSLTSHTSSLRHDARDLTCCSEPAKASAFAAFQRTCQALSDKASSSAMQLWPHMAPAAASLLMAEQAALRTNGMLSWRKTASKALRTWTGREPKVRCPTASAAASLTKGLTSPRAASSSSIFEAAPRAPKALAAVLRTCQSESLRNASARKAADEPCFAVFRSLAASKRSPELLGL
mmetsp:Transcript_76381/g.168748  ORF Transcript_76381/g.168748 Transcript_76381/m.168748 type:complete len:253 (+) Transcript_76381:1374-2132(+)